MIGTKIILRGKTWEVVSIVGQYAYIDCEDGKKSAIALGYLKELPLAT